MTRILGVHGIGNLQAGCDERSASQLLGGRWQAALARAVTPRAEIDMRVAYYAHHLTSSHAQGPAEVDQLAPSARQLVIDWAVALGASAETAQGRLGTPIRQAADWIANKYGLDNRYVHILIARFAGEVNRYLTMLDRRVASREAVATAIRRYSPSILIAHSLGSVIAYEAFFSDSQLSIDLLVTVGSPLGMPGVIFEKLVPAPISRIGGRPPGVRQWINIADPGDFIAVPRHLHQRFDGVTGDLEAPIGTFQFHRATGYLSCSAMAGVLASHLNPA